MIYTNFSHKFEVDPTYFENQPYSISVREKPFNSKTGKGEKYEEK